MDQVELYFYREEDGSIPVREWLLELEDLQPKAHAACVHRLMMLEIFGNQMRRPHADYLEAGIYELRVRHGTLNYRLLYFFHGRRVAIIAHALMKEKSIPKSDLIRAKWRKSLFEKNPEKHRARENCYGKR